MFAALLNTGMRRSRSIVKAQWLAAANLPSRRFLCAGN
jgi:hypothetical protein